MLSELDYIRHMLTVIGETADSSNYSEHPSTIQAKAILESTNFDLQAIGWWFNVDKNLILSPNDAQEIVIPGSILDFNLIGTDWYGGCTPNYSRFVYRQGKVYDTEQNTYKITQKISANITSLIPVDQVPAQFSVALKHRAAYHMYNNEDGDTGKLNALNELADRAENELRKAQIRATRQNALNSPFARMAQYRVTNPTAGVLGEGRRFREGGW